MLWEDQINQTVKWLSRMKNPVDLVLFNVYQPGNCIRTFGPNSVEAVQVQILDSDWLIQHILTSDWSTVDTN